MGLGMLVRRIKSTCTASVAGTDGHAGVSPSEENTLGIFNWSMSIMFEKDCDDATARPGAPKRHRPGPGSGAAERLCVDVCRQGAAQGAGSGCRRPVRSRLQKKRRSEDSHR